MGIKQNTSKTYENSAQTKCQAKIVDILIQQVKTIQNGKPVFEEAIALVLDHTIFHPQGGGQPSDKGLINNTPILTVREDKEYESRPIYHFLDVKDFKHDFKLGQMVELNVDDIYRKKCSISHTAGHLIADILELNPYFSIYKAVLLKAITFQEVNI